MILYHSSYMEVKKPDLSISRPNVDLGLGFYASPIYTQAEKWTQKFIKQNKDAVVSEYNFDEQAYNYLNILKFDSYCEEWLDFILTCRSGNDQTNYDIVLGGVANDKVFNTVELYFDNLINKQEAIQKLKYEKPNMQFCFRTEQALSYLTFIRSIKL